MDHVQRRFQLEIDLLVGLELGYDEVGELAGYNVEVGELAGYNVDLEGLGCKDDLAHLDYGKGCTFQCLDCKMGYILGPVLEVGHGWGQLENGRGHGPEREMGRVWALVDINVLERGDYGRGCSRLEHELELGVDDDFGLVEGELELAGTNELAHGGYGKDCIHWARVLELVVVVDDDELGLEDLVEELQGTWEDGRLPPGIRPFQPCISL
jgi:hypothetical protein